MSIAPTPSFWQQHGLPDSPSALVMLPCVQYGHATTPRSLLFRRGSQLESVLLQPVVYSSILSAMLELVKTGRYFAVLPHFMVSPLLDSGELQAVLQDCPLEPAPLYALYPKRDYVPPKVRLFLAELKRQLSNRGGL